MNNRQNPIFLIIALAFIVIVSIAAAAAGSSMAPVACAGTKAPQAAVTGFFDALCAGDMQLADSYVSDYSGLGFDGEAEGFEKLLYNQLISSYSYSLQGELHPKPGKRCYVQTVAFRHIDLSKATENIGDVYENSLRNASIDFPADEIYNDDGSYNPELVDLAMGRTIKKIFSEKEQYTVTENIDVEVEYNGDRWEVVVSPRLADAILGESDSASVITDSGLASGSDNSVSAADSKASAENGQATETEGEQQ